MAIPQRGPHIIFERVRRFFCQKCLNKWSPRGDEIPRVCPRCKSYAWHLDKIAGVGRPPKAVVE